MALAIAWTAAIEPLLGSGFSWDYIVYGTARWCQEGWWTNLLYINNFYSGTQGEGLCLGQTWYLACDFQMFVVAPLVILPMFYWQKNIWGLMCWLGFMAGATITQITLSLVHDLPPSHLWL